MDNKAKISLAEKCGLTYSGIEDDGTPQFIGTQKQWAEYQRWLDMSESQLVIYKVKDGRKYELVNKTFNDPKLFAEIEADLQELQMKWGNDLI